MVREAEIQEEGRDGCDDLSVDIVLDLLRCTISVADWPRALIPREVLQDLFVEVRLASDAVNGLQLLVGGGDVS